MRLHTSAVIYDILDDLPDVLVLVAPHFVATAHDIALDLRSLWLTRSYKFSRNAWFSLALRFRSISSVCSPSKSVGSLGYVEAEPKQLTLSCSSISLASEIFLSVLLGVYTS